MLSGSASTLTEAEVAAALARHPRIGERAGAGHDVEFSTQGAVRRRPRRPARRRGAGRGNAAYEAKFDRVFLIRAAGRSSDEILAELERRLGNTDEAELAEVVTQLSEIAVLRLEQSVQSSYVGERAHDEHDQHHVLDTSRGRPGAGIPVRLQSLSRHRCPDRVRRHRRRRPGDGLGPERLDAGTYRLVFDTSVYFAGISSNVLSDGRDRLHGRRPERALPRTRPVEPVRLLHVPRKLVRGRVRSHEHCARTKSVR